MDPVLSQALAALITAFSTVLLLAGSYYFGPDQRVGRKWRRRVRKDDGASFRADEERAHEGRMSDEDEPYNADE